MRFAPIDYFIQLKFMQKIEEVSYQRPLLISIVFSIFFSLFFSIFIPNTSHTWSLILLLFVLAAFGFSMDIQWMVRRTKQIDICAKYWTRLFFFSSFSNCQSFYCWTFLFCCVCFTFSSFSSSFFFVVIWFNQTHKYYQHLVPVRSKISKKKTSNVDGKEADEI